MSASGFTGLLLTTTGRKTGKPRSRSSTVRARGPRLPHRVELGRQAHPAWSANLMANPEATLTIKGKKIPVTARMLQGEEREKIWPVLTSTWPAYDVYTDRSGRELRVFELTPR